MKENYEFKPIKLFFKNLPCVTSCLCREFSKKICIYIGIMVKVFTNGLEDQGLILGRVIPKTQKMVLDASLLSTHHYKVWIKSKWINPGKGVVPSPTSRCSSYWKREPSSRPLLQSANLHKYIYIYIYIYTHTHTYIYIYIYIYTLKGIGLQMISNLVFRFLSFHILVLCFWLYIWKFWMVKLFLL